MISDDKKEEIRESADLVEVVGDYVRLKRSGSGFSGLCPFHDEKTPSFSVTPRLDIYKCFGCGVSGDVFSFVMEMEGVGFNEAMRTLASRYGVNLPEDHLPEENLQYREKEGIYHALRFAGLFYFRQLKESGEADRARDYLDRRGYDGGIIKQFGLGYAPAGGDVLLKAAGKEGIEEEYLHKADLIKPGRGSDGWYDTFRDRLMFPIFNPSGKVIAFAGRVLGNSKTAKYINSAQTLVYNKSEVVYGINFSKNEIRKQEEVILVEGYTDVITMVQKGVKNVVASSGTALTARQVKILKRYGSKLLMIYDSDSAGQAAMKRGISIALAESMDVDLLELPENEDPDSFLKKFGKESFLELKKKEALDFISFGILQAEQQGEMESPGGRTKIITGILENIAEIPDSLARQVYVQHLHQKTQRYRNSSDRELFDQLGALIQKKSGQNRRASPSGISSSSPGPPLRDFPAGAYESQRESPQPEKVRLKKPGGEMELIRLMLRYGREMIQYIGNLCQASLFEDEQLREFFLDILSRDEKGEEVSVEHYSRRNSPWPELLGTILLERHTASERHHEETGAVFKKDRDPYRIARSAIRPLRLYYLKRELAELVEKTKTADAGQKKQLVEKQKSIQSEISLIERTPADELFPDPAGRQGADRQENRNVFEYKMKNERIDGRP